MKTTKKTKKPPVITRQDREREPITRGKLIPIIEDLKDFIRSTAKGTENSICKKMDKRFEVLETAVTTHSKEIIGLRTDMTEVKTILSEHGVKLDEHGVKLDNLQKTVDEHTVKLDEHTARLDNIEKGMNRIETSFSEKLDNHEARITTLETSNL